MRRRGNILCWCCDGKQIRIVDGAFGVILGRIFGIWLGLAFSCQCVAAVGNWGTFLLMELILSLIENKFFICIW